MTTIVYDRRTKTLVADTRGTKGTRKTRVTKLQALPGGAFFAGCGSHSICLQVYAWLSSGCKSERPVISVDAGDIFEGIVVKADGTAYMLEPRLVPIPVEDDFIAIGSGSDYVMGALAAGKTALEAISIASQMDAFTGPPYHVVNLSEPTPQKPATKKKRVPKL